MLGIGLCVNTVQMQTAWLQNGYLYIQLELCHGGRYDTSHKVLLHIWMRRVLKMIRDFQKVTFGMC